MVFDGARACHDNWVCITSNGDGSGSVSFSNQNASTFCLKCTTHKLVGSFERDEASDSALLLEGGGSVNGAFLRAGLIDELNLILCPAVDGTKGAPTVFDCSNAEADQPAPVTAMTLECSKVLDGGAMLLRYRIQNSVPNRPADKAPA